MVRDARRKLLMGVPAGFVLLAAEGMWVWVNGGQWAAAGEGLRVGWLMMLLVVATVAGIVTAAAMMRPLVGLALLASVVAVLVVGVGMSAWGFMTCVALVSLFVAWLALWGGVVRLLKRFGPGISTGVPLTLAALWMGSPVVLMPLVRWAAHWTAPGPSAWQGRVVEVVRHGCPFLAVLDVMPPGEMGGVRSNWSTLPGMYRWSGLGQEVPMNLPNIWVCVTIYAVVAMIVAVACLLFQGRRKQA